MTSHLSKQDYSLNEDVILTQFSEQADIFIQLIKRIKIKSQTSIFSQKVNAKTPRESIKSLVALISQFFNHHPETFVLFKLMFIPTILLSDTHDGLIRFYETWERGLFQQLRTIFPAEEAKRLSIACITLLKGGMVNAQFFSEASVVCHEIKHFLLEGIQVSTHMNKVNKERI